MLSDILGKEIFDKLDKLAQKLFGCSANQLADIQLLVLYIIYNEGRLNRELKKGNKK